MPSMGEGAFFVFGALGLLAIAKADSAATGDTDAGGGGGTRIGNRTVAEIIAASEVPSYSLICPLTHSVCFQQCYDPATGECVDDRIACPKSQLRCGNSGCYSPDGETDCIQSDSVYEAPILCERGELVCGRQCYNPNMHVCEGVRAAGHDVWLCPVGQKLCGHHKCYDPAIEHCTGPASYPQVCLLGLELCDYSCYDPAEKVCFNDTARGHSRTSTGRTEVLCERGELACGRSCYDPNSEEVTGKGLRCTAAGALCSEGQEGCDRWSCYSPAAGETCRDDDQERKRKRRRSRRSLKCDSRWYRCGDGWECYDPETEDCFPDKWNKICYKGRSACDFDKCYWAHNETCYPRGSQPGYGSHACPKEQGVCGYKCFDPDMEACYISGSTRVLCESGQKGCGYKCYDPAKNVCVGRRVTLCRMGEDACGGVCFRPNRGITCYDDRTLCRAGKLGCGCKCYDPKTHSCNKIPNGRWSWSD